MLLTGTGTERSLEVSSEGASREASSARAPRRSCQGAAIDAYREQDQSCSRPVLPGACSSLIDFGPDRILEGGRTGLCHQRCDRCVSFVPNVGISALCF